MSDGISEGERTRREIVGFNEREKERKSGFSVAKVYDKLCGNSKF
jgi:hypothetical protein